VPVDERCDLVREVIRNAQSVGTPTLLVRRLVHGLGVTTESSTHATPPEELDERHARVSIDCAKKLERAAAERIARGAADVQLWNVQRVGWVLAEWRRWGDPDAVSTWLSSVLADEAQVAPLVLALRSERATPDGIRYRFDPRWLDDLAPRNDVVGAIRRLRASTQDEAVAGACDQYLLELEMLEQGRDPERFD
jgi:hypothetical protein